MSSSPGRGSAPGEGAVPGGCRGQPLCLETAAQQIPPDNPRAASVVFSPCSSALVSHRKAGPAAAESAEPAAPALCKWGTRTCTQNWPPIRGGRQLGSHGRWMGVSSVHTQCRGLDSRRGLILEALPAQGVVAASSPGRLSCAQPGRGHCVPPTAERLGVSQQLGDSRPEATMRGWRHLGPCPCGTVLAGF